MNTVLLSGELDRDAEFKDLGETKITNIRLKTKGYKDRFDWHSVVAFNDKAEALVGLKQGDYLAVVGRLQHRSYEKDGQKHYVTEVVVSEAG